MKDYVGVVLLNQNKDIYLIKEDDVNKIGQNRWNLPGGSSDSGESLAESAIRETEEETGYRSEVKSLLGCYKCSKGEASWLYIVFESEITSEKADHVDPSVKEGRWFSKAEFMNLTKSEIVHSDMHLVYELALSGKNLKLDTVKFINYT